MHGHQAATVTKDKEERDSVKRVQGTVQAGIIMRNTGQHLKVNSRFTGSAK